MSATQEIIQQFSHLPSEVKNPEAIGAAVVATGAALIGSIELARRSKDQYAAQFPNPEAAERSIARIRGTDIEGNSRQRVRRRLAPWLGTLVGAGLAATSIVGGMSFENDKADHDANVVVVADASYSMLHTRDMGGDTSRHEAVVSGLNSADYEGRLGVVEAAGDVDVSLPLQQDWKDEVDGLKKPTVNPNGGELAKAVSTAVSLLPRRSDSEGKLVRDGKVVIISDGTIASSPKAMQKSAQHLSKSGASFKVIVPGSSQSNYKLDGSLAVQSGANTEVFDSFGGGNVERATNKAEVVNEIHSALHEAGTNHEKDDWKLPLYIGGAILAASAIAAARQRIRKIV